MRRVGRPLNHYFPRKAAVVFSPQGLVGQYHCQRVVGYASVTLDISIDQYCDLSLQGELENVSDCGALVYLYNIERIRSRLFAENVGKLLEDTPLLAEDVNVLLPGLDKRLAENPNNILDSFNSFEVLMKIVEAVQAEEAATLRSDMRTMVSQHTALFASSEGYSKEVMSMLPESPMWNLIKWKATSIIIGKSMNELMDMLGDPCALRLRCNSRTTQGLPMTVSAFFEIPDTDGKVSSFLLEKLQGYTGRSLTDISTSVWSNCVLSKEPVQGSITCKNVSGDSLQIGIQSAQDLQSICMALSYIICNDEIPQPGILEQMFQRSPTHMWIPADGRIQWARDDASTYRLKMTSTDDTIHILDGDTINAILECLDALALIDSQYSLPMPRLSSMNAP